MEAATARGISLRVDSAVDRPDLGTLTDDQLILLVDSLADQGADEVFDSAFDELARRIREEEAGSGRADVEADIAHLRSVFTSRGGGGPDAVGVREPRRPSPSAGSAEVALELPDGYENAA
jgi:hypothetical protein